MRWYLLCLLIRPSILILAWILLNEVVVNIIVGSVVLIIHVLISHIHWYVASLEVLLHSILAVLLIVAVWLASRNTLLASFYRVLLIHYLTTRCCIVKHLVMALLWHLLHRKSTSSTSCATSTSWSLMDLMRLSRLLVCCIRRVLHANLLTRGHLVTIPGLIRPLLIWETLKPLIINIGLINWLLSILRIIRINIL